MLHMDTVDDLKRFGAFCWGKWGAWVYDEWREHNGRYFADKLKVGGIVWGLTPHGRSLGYYQPGFNVITLHLSLVEPKSESPWNLHRNLLGARYASDVLLHEMVHQHIEQAEIKAAVVGKISPDHNNSAWIGEIIRVASLLGLEIKAEVVKQRRIRKADSKKSYPSWAPRDGYLSITELSSFPHSVRPIDYYGKVPEKQPERDDGFTVTVTTLK